MAQNKVFTIRASKADLAMIKAEQKRLAAQGVDASKSEAARALMKRGSTITDTAAKGRTLAHEGPKK